jgi:hypothetical protein
MPESIAGHSCRIALRELVPLILFRNRRYVMCLGKDLVGAKIRMRPLQLPDDIEQRLLEGQHTRATHALMERYAIPPDQARKLLTRWLDEHRTNRTPPEAGSSAPSVARGFGRRKTDRPHDGDP